MSDSRHGKREFPVHDTAWPAHGRGTGVLGRPEHAEAVEGDGEQAEPKKAAAPRAPRPKAAKEPARSGPAGGFSAVGSARFPG